MENQIKKCVILGAGSNAEVIIDIINSTLLDYDIVILDSNKDRVGQTLLGYPIVGDDTYIKELENPNDYYFINGIGSIKDNSLRKKVYEFCVEFGLKPLSLFHPSSTISCLASIGRSVVCYPNSLINTSVVIGDNVLINSGAIVEHHCQIGDHVHLGPRSVLSGGVTVKRGGFIGVGATIIQNITIGENAVVAAGATVINDVAENQIVAGCPARVIS